MKNYRLLVQIINANMHDKFVELVKLGSNSCIVKQFLVTQSQSVKLDCG